VSNVGNTTSAIESSAVESMFQLSPTDVISRPFPHVIKQDILEPNCYRQLKAEFPADDLFDNRGKRIGARTGRDLYRGDSGFEEFIEQSPAWQKLYTCMNSQAFLKFTMDMFGPYLHEFQCRVSAEKAQIVSHTESRFSVWSRARKARSFAAGTKQDPNKLFVRFDIEQSDTGYAKPVHCDNHSRLVSFLVYFCDADEIGLEGGDLRIHAHAENKRYSDYERHPKESDTKVIQTLRPRDNLGVFFLCSNNSYHSVTAVTRSRDYRRFIYTNLSSTAESIW